MNPEFKAMINQFIEAQENVLLDQMVAFATVKLRELYRVKNPSDFLYGRLFGTVIGFAAAHYSQFHGEPITPEVTNEIEEMVRVKCKQVKQKMDDADFQ